MSRTSYDYKQVLIGFCMCPNTIIPIAADFVVARQFFELVVVGNLDVLDSNITSYSILLGPICIYEVWQIGSSLRNKKEQKGHSGLWSHFSPSQEMYILHIY